MHLMIVSTVVRGAAAHARSTGKLSRRGFSLSRLASAKSGADGLNPVLSKSSFHARVARGCFPDVGVRLGDVPGGVFNPISGVPEGHADKRQTLPGRYIDGNKFIP